MNILANMTVKSRLIMAACLLISFFIAFGIVSVWQMNALGELTVRLYKHPLAVSNAALTAKAGVISIHCNLKDIYNAESTPAIALSIQKIQTEERNVYQALDLISLRILGDEGKQLVAEAIEMFSNWKPIRVEVEEMVIRQGAPSTDMITREKAAAYSDRLERKMTDLAQYARNKADGFMIDAKNVKGQIVNSLIIFTVSMAIISLLIGFLISTNIMSSLGILKETMARITKTGELARVSLPGKNEITEIAEHFNRVVDRLHSLFWVGDGENLLNRELYQDLSDDDVMAVGLTQTARYVEACAGALYQYDAEERMLELSASYALVERAHLANRFTLGEGIVGQVAKEKKAILLNHIRREEMVGESGTLSEPPAVIFAVPLLFEHDILYGVLEIASFKQFNEHEKAFIESAADIIVTLMHTSGQSRKIKMLLKEAEESNTVLQDQAKELTSMNEESRLQSLELQEQNRELETQRLEIEEANRLKSEFLSNMSHELRTPLNSVNALSRVLIQQAADRMSQEELNFLRIIERNGKHLLSLINNILDLSKIESGQVELSITRFSLPSLIDTILEDVSPLAEEKGLILDSDLGPGLPEMESDEPRVFQILQNIIANAVKFTEKGSVHVRAKFETGMFSVRVTDTGIGISEENLGSIFNEFRQADGASTRRYEGTGLGLSIAYKAATLLGGTIKVQSTKGEGSKFVVSLPQKLHGHSAASPVSLAPSIPRSQSKPAQNKPPSPRKTILIVDDDPKILAFMARVFRDEGYGTLVTTSGQEALDLAAAYQPFAITLDVIMPEMDGWEILSRLKNNPVTAHIPVIVVSVSQDKETGFALGAIGYISKPVKPELLLNEMRRVLGQLPLSVMVVDDSKMDRENTTKILEKEGMEVITAENGEACLSLLSRQEPDLLILDLVMPGMDGFEVLEQLRSKSKYEEIPVIVVTAKDLTGREKARLEQQASSVLLKRPLTADQLVEKIKAILQEIQEERGPAGPVGDRDRLLLVEDNDATVVQVQKALEPLAYAVDLARDGREALAYMEHHRPIGIILDLMMPHVDGFEVLETLKNSPETREIPVLILSAKELTVAERDRLNANHIHQFIQKGDVDRAQLVHCVQEMLGLDSKAPPADPKSGPEPDPEPVSVPVHLNRSILVVEDNPDNMVTIKAVLGREYEIEEAVDGETGLKKAGELMPSLILLDMSLPGMDGMSVLSRLKSNPDTRDIPVIALTAQAMKGDRERMLEAGCHDYISKPIDPDRARKTIAKWYPGRSDEPHTGH